MQAPPWRELNSKEGTAADRGPKLEMRETGTRDQRILLFIRERHYGTVAGAQRCSFGTKVDDFQSLETVVR